MNSQPDDLSKFRTEYLDYLEGDRTEPPSQDRLSDKERRIAQAFIESTEDAAGIDPYGSRPSTAQLLARIQRPTRAAAFAADATAQPPRTLSDAARMERLRERLPLDKVRRRGWIPKSGVDAAEAAACDLLEIAHLDAESPFAYAARRSNRDKPLTLEQRAWLGRIRQIARKQRTPHYDPEALADAARRLPRELQSGPRALHKAVELLAQAGACLVFCQGLPGGRLAGAVTFLPNGGPVIGLTTRGDRFDSVVYTLLHECAHLSLGHITADSGPILDDEDYARAPENKREQEANDQASRWLFPEGLDIAVALTDVVAAARRHSVHPSCVAGLIQHEADNWRILNEYRCKVRDELQAAGLLSN